MKSKTLNRRAFTAACGLGATGLAFHSLLADEQAKPHHAASAKRVILLFMSGGPSQVDTFGPNPELAKLAGQDVPESIAQLVPKIKRAGLKNLLASPWKSAKHGESGLSVSELLPETAKHVDDLCVIRSVTHRNPVHGPGECVALTGSANGQRPSLGSWSIYGLGSEASELPAYITMNLHTDGMHHPQAAGWSAGFLPSRFQSVVVDPQKGIHDVNMPSNVNADRRRRELEVIESLNRGFLNRIGTSELEARLRSYEVAFAMQTAAPELFALNSESKSIHERYGLNEKPTERVGRACLLARRMAQRGVRFIQVRVGGWDAHGNIKGNHEKLAERTDRPIAALLEDLKQQGMLDSTLVVWGGEFGRTPTMEGRANGRDHSPAAYSVWMAGGGVRGGQVIGATDPIGYTVTERPVKPLDLHATILHALGIDSTRLTFNHHGLQETPLGVTGGAPVVEAFNA